MEMRRRWDTGVLHITTALPSSLDSSPSCSPTSSRPSTPSRTTTSSRSWSHSNLRTVLSWQGSAHDLDLFSLQETEPGESHYFLITFSASLGIFFLGTVSFLVVGDVMGWF